MSRPADSRSEIDPAQRKAALRSISNGLFILTARAGERVGASTVSWVTQASFRPPLVAMALRKGSSVHECLVQAGLGALHVLDRDQIPLARAFMRHELTVDEDRINGEAWTAGPGGVPILDAPPAVVVGALRERVDAGGDHEIVVVEVVDAIHRRPVEPLTVAASPWEYGG